MMRRTWWLPLLLAAPTGALAQGAGPDSTTVRAILFYSPTCPHCQEVITEGLPPILDRFGDRLQIAGVNTYTPGGAQLFQAAIEALEIPPERVGVPTLVVGSTVLIGSFEIPDQLPGIVEAALQQDGIDWPPVPLILEVLAAQGLTRDETAGGEEAQDSAAAAEVAEAPPDTATRTDTDTANANETAIRPDTAAPTDTEAANARQTETRPANEEETAVADDTGDAAAGGAEALSAGSQETAAAESTAPAPVPDAAPAADETDPVAPAIIDPDARAALVHQLSVRDRLMLDPVGNGMAVAVLILMLAALAVVAGDVVAGRIRIPAAAGRAIPVLALVGMAVAAYLAFVEVTGAQAVCGPVGDCNTVQQSRFARLLGVPVGVLGVAGYALMLALWIAGWAGPERVSRITDRAVWWLALAATAFSVYLTALEPFVIGATCAWCLTSAIVATLLLLAATPAWRQAGDGGVGVSPTRRPSVSH